MKKKIKYVEPVDYFPKEIREKYKLGEYSDINAEKQKEMNKTKDDNKKEKDIKEDKQEVKMLGAIIGDIVGSRFEFNNIKTKKFKLFDKGCVVTDDSVMSVAVAEMCLNGYVPDNKKMIIKTFKTAQAPQSLI